MKDTLQNKIAKSVLDEFNGEERTQRDYDVEFESIIDLLECRRTEKDYDWMSDVFIPEFPSIHLTEASQWSNQYFQNRDFVEVYLDDGNQGSSQKAQAAKRYLNTMLNVRELYHYQKYMRARSINSMRGSVIAVCSWKQELRDNFQTVPDKVPMGQNSQGITQYYNSYKTVNNPIPIVDRFHYEVPDPRNVRYDKKYCYSIQEKDWVTVRSEMSYYELKELERENGYINLDKVKELAGSIQTDSKKAVSDGEKSIPESDPYIKKFDVLERFGKVWATFKDDDVDEYGNPIKISTAFNEDGSIKEEARLIEAIVTVAYSGEKTVLIRFQPTPFITSTGVPYRPLVRGLCYIHPTRDVGMSDGTYAKELQVFINDMVNLGIDRTKLATFPTLQMKRHAFDDNDSVYFEPEHPILVDEMGDVQEFKITDDIAGALNLVNFGIGKLQQVESIYPNTMGGLAGKSSTTATEVSGANQQSNLRSNYKSLTFEYTFLQEFYWMMLQMAAQFMHQVTIKKIFGNLDRAFDPDADFMYKPVTSNIETEYNKDKKLQRYDQMLGRIQGIPNPAIVPIIALIIARELEILGDEFSTIAPFVKKLAGTPNEKDGGEGKDVKDGKDLPMQNQMGGMQGLEEQSARSAMNAPKQ
jgi:hypothetical protein